MIDTSLFSRHCIDDALSTLLASEDSSVHGYTPASGLPPLRRALAEALALYELKLSPERIYVTCGAAAGLAIAARAILASGDEALFLSDPRPEQSRAVEAAGAAVSTSGLTDRTRLVILSGNTPIPDGLAASLRAAESEFGRPLYLLADRLSPSPAAEALLREYGSFLLNEDFGDELSGEAIGFLAVGARSADADLVYDAVAGAGRAMGYVNPPSLMQRAILACLG